MNEDDLKKVLQEGLQNIPSYNFNERVLYQLQLQRKKIKPILSFDEPLLIGCILCSFLSCIIFLLVTSQRGSFDAEVREVKEAAYLISILGCVIPLFTIALNTIHQKAIKA